MLEVFIERIKFAIRVADVPNVHDLRINVEFSHLINANMDRHYLRDYIKDEEPLKGSVNLDLKNSFTFICNPDDLLMLVLQTPLILTLTISGKFGKVYIPWRQNFIEMIEKSKNNEDILPATVKNEYEVIDDDETKCADIMVALRLSLCQHSNEVL
ncbi:hypothetical protein FQA39_LY09910 [Lamprigera yunnana]|nr:hypothetical protein FQA39_LY09910 [Lamprigera yunnana]